MSPTSLGDGIVAYFGALQPNPWQCNDAVHAALAMRAAIREYNVELEREGLPLLALGIGIDRGLGLVGLVGSRERMEYDFVGRTVNVAARVQTLTRIHQADILVTEALRAELDARFVLMPMPAEFVKGIAEPVVTYAVREGPSAAAPSARRQETDDRRKGAPPRSKLCLRPPPDPERRAIIISLDDLLRSRARRGAVICIRVFVQKADESRLAPMPRPK